jgi:hypothetical protein
MSAVSGGGNYISDAELMAWLAEQQDSIYGQLRASMDTSEQRGQFADDLNNIKSELHAANESKDFSQVSADMKAFTEKYGDDPAFKKLVEGLQPMFDEVENNQANVDANKEALQAYKYALSQWNLQQAQRHGADPGQSGKPIEPGGVQEQHYSDDKLKEWDELISGKIDASSHDDQLAMIHIQELKANIDQSSQLTSTLISGSDKTTSSIINNIA